MLNKHFNKTTRTTTGQMEKWIKGLQCTKKYNIREEETAQESIKPISVLITVPNPEYTSGKIYTYLCSIFLVQAKRLNKYIIIIYK